MKYRGYREKNALSSLTTIRFFCNGIQKAGVFKMREELKMKQAILEEQVRFYQEVSRRLWKIYYKEMMRLIENPSLQPDTSEFERFAHDNMDITFSRELALLFRDAIQFGFGHAEFISENLFREQ